MIENNYVYIPNEGQRATKLHGLEVHPEFGTTNESGPLVLPIQH